MLKTQERTKLMELVKKEIPDNYDLFDTESEIDSSLTYEENESIILDKLSLLKENNRTDKSVLLSGEKEKFENNS